MIAIDMKAPKSCLDCPFINYTYTYKRNRWVCGINKKWVTEYMGGGKPEFCPVHEVKENDSSKRS